MQHINPATVAHIAATLATQSENLRSDGEMIDYGLKPNHYRPQRIAELTALALDFFVEAKKQVEELETSCFPV